MNSRFDSDDQMMCCGDLGRVNLPALAQQSVWVEYVSSCKCTLYIVRCALYSAIRASHQLTADNKGPAPGGIFSSLHLCRRKFGYICHPSFQPLAIHARGVN